MPSDIQRVHLPFAGGLPDTCPASPDVCAVIQAQALSSRDEHERTSRFSYFAATGIGLPHINGAAQHPFSCHLQWSLSQPLDVDALNNRLQALVAGNEILRTRLMPVPGLRHPVQVIDETGSLAVNLQDLRQHSGADQDAALARLATQPRDWATPLCVTLVRLSDEQAVLDLAAASSHFDLASLKWLAGALLHDTATDLSDTLQYADYAEWRWSLVEEAPDHPGASF